METIATLTLNPAIDVSYSVDRVFPGDKIRSQEDRCDPGGGGINVARVISRLGGTVRAYYMAAGATGDALDGLLDLHQMPRNRMNATGQTRLCTTIHEQMTGLEYKFIGTGPNVRESEWRACLNSVSLLKCDWLVVSGSLPPGIPNNFYADIRDALVPRGIRLVVDAPGAVLAVTMQAPGTYLIKPSLGEFKALMNREFASVTEIELAALDLVKQGFASLLVVTLGPEGAILAQPSGATHLPAIAVDAKSTVGAGDSFLGAMVSALAVGRDPTDAFRYGMAAGAAAVLNPGTGLCNPVDVERLFLSFCEHDSTGILS